MQAFVRIRVKVLYVLSQVYHDLFSRQCIFHSDDVHVASQIPIGLKSEFSHDSSSIKKTPGVRRSVRSGPRPPCTAPRLALPYISQGVYPLLDLPSHGKLDRIPCSMHATPPS